MNYKFPYISHIDQVLPLIEGNKAFIVARKPNYTIIDYVVANEEVFPDVVTENDAILRELRGIVFDTEGKLIGRKFHKFFNVNERQETHENILQLENYSVTEKLDGSLIAAVKVNDKIEFHTMMGGETDIAKQVLPFIEKNPRYVIFCKNLIDTGFTPLFEWLSPKNQIVVYNPIERLVLIGIRDMFSGTYWPYHEMKFFADTQKIDVVKQFKGRFSLDYVSKLTDQEGFVIELENGHRMKAKSEWYLLRHRSKDQIRSECHVVNMILEGTLDDVKPILSDEDYDRVAEYESKFNERIFDILTRLVKFVDERKYLSKKEFAVDHIREVSGPLHKIAFSFFDTMSKNEDTSSFYFQLIDHIKKFCTNNTKFAEMKEAFFSDLKFRSMWENE